ncbi:Pyridoxal phosphate-dependent transferase, major domain [Penicillium camemberti]|uniref:Pyridoxal phosphate-dependent transferase, major domain n=1 Tax=Penicillium camemberti (strain FM 013) TaxID=1429867 RepID=A0A0G4NZD4_PENC3|nr:Pyridoxal phosphate-dependent transferase, major domain [Penicillium camemberti]
MVYYESLFQEMLKGQQLRRPAMKKNEPAFFQRLEQAMDTHREKIRLNVLKPRWDDDVLDLTTSDFLSLSRTGRIREAFLTELARCGDFRLSASGSRVQYGNYEYIVEVEHEIAAFHGADTAWICHSGFYANIGILEAIALPGDAIVFDEFSHASTGVGMKVSLAAHKLPFAHNSPDSLRDVLTSLKKLDSGFTTGEKSVLICVESLYSMEGDLCPLKELVAVAKEVFPNGSAQFIVDEAHSNGVIGPNGSGLVQLLGLEKEIAIRVHMCSKALGSTGGVILCNQTVRSALAQYSRCLTYSGAPSVPMVASIRAGYQLLASGQTQKEQNHIQEMVRYFFDSLLDDPIWQEAVDEGLVSVPLAEDHEARSVVSHVVPIKVKPGHDFSLFVHLAMANMNAYPMAYPVVPKGTALVRMLFHAHNTKEEVDRIIAAVGEWVEEMLAIERGESKNVLPSAMRKFHALQTANGWS